MGRGVSAEHVGWLGEHIPRVDAAMDIPHNGTWKEPACG